MVCAGWPVQSLLALAPAGIVPFHDCAVCWPGLDGTVIVVPLSATASVPGLAARAGTMQAAAAPTATVIRPIRGKRRLERAVMGTPLGVIPVCFVAGCPFPVVAHPPSTTALKIIAVLPG